MNLDKTKVNHEDLTGGVGLINEYTKTKEAEDQAIKLKDHYLVAKARLQLVQIFIKNGAYKEALAKNANALSYFSVEGKNEELAQCWKNMALIYGFLGDIKKQQEFNKKCLQITRMLNQPLKEIKILNNIGHTYMEMCMYSKAEKIFKRNLKNKHGNTNMVCTTYKNLSQLYFKKKELKKTAKYSNLTITLAKKYNYPLFLSAGNFFLGKIHEINKEWGLAAKHVKISIEAIERTKSYSKELPMIIESYIQILSKLGDIDQINIYLKKYINLTKEKHRISQDQSIKSLQFQFEINEIEKERIFLEEQNKKLQNANQTIELQKQSLEKKSQELLVVNKQLKEFAHVVSHDLKQPIRSINTYVSLLELELGDNLQETPREFIEQIKSYTRKITRFVDDILLYAEAGRNNYPLELVDCNELIEIVKTNLIAQLNENNGQLLFEDLPTIVAHHSLILQIFQNLISNAIKFRRKEIPPIVKVKSIDHPHNWIFEIEDNGIGVKKEDQLNIFKLFSRLHYNYSFEGSGIGLSTVLKVIKKYNGTIELESVVGKGTIFKVSIPKNKLTTD